MLWCLWKQFTRSDLIFFFFFFEYFSGHFTSVLTVRRPLFKNIFFIFSVAYALLSLYSLFIYIYFLCRERCTFNIIYNANTHVYLFLYNLGGKWFFALGKLVKHELDTFSRPLSTLKMHMHHIESTQVNKVEREREKEAEPNKGCEHKGGERWSEHARKTAR